MAGWPRQFVGVLRHLPIRAILLCDRPDPFRFDGSPGTEIGRVGIAGCEVGTTGSAGATRPSAVDGIERKIQSVLSFWQARLADDKGSPSFQRIGRTQGLRHLADGRMKRMVPVLSHGTDTLRRADSSVEGRQVVSGSAESS